MLRIFAVALFSLPFIAPLGAPPSPAQQQLSNRPIPVMLPFTACCPSDSIARFIAPKTTTMLGQSVIVDNRPGAVGVTAVVISPQLDSGTPYDPLRDLVQVPVVVSSTTPITPCKNCLQKRVRSQAKSTKAPRAQEVCRIGWANCQRKPQALKCPMCCIVGAQHSQPHYSGTRFRSGLLICQFYCSCFVLGQSSHLRLARQNACHGGPMCRR